MEASAVHTAVMLADQTNCPLIVQKVMSKASAEAVANARRRGKPLHIQWNTKFRNVRSVQGEKLNGKNHTLEKKIEAVLYLLVCSFS